MQINNSPATGTDNTGGAISPHETLHENLGGAAPTAPPTSYNDTDAAAECNSAYVQSEEFQPFLKGFDEMITAKFPTSSID